MKSSLTEAVHVMRSAAHTCLSWARQSREGGWSTHQVEANERLAQELMNAASATEIALNSADVAARGVKVARTPMEIIEAHDLLDGILRGEIKGVAFDKGEMEARARVARDVLCWILGHDSQEEFQKNVDAMKRRVVEAGYEMHLKQ